MKKLHWIVVYMLFIITPTFAEEKGTKTFSISHILDNTNGLPSNNITYLVTQKDIIWVGTDKGIACYNKVPENSIIIPQFYLLEIKFG